MIPTNFMKIGCRFAENIFFLKIQDGGQDGGHVIKRMFHSNSS